MPAAQELKPTQTGKIAFPKIEKGKRNTPYCPLLAANPGRSRKLATLSRDESAIGLPSLPKLPLWQRSRITQTTTPKRLMSNTQASLCPK
jgi:hypothetical protein